MPVYESGKPFPGVYPEREGVLMEFGPDGDPNVLIQYPNCRAKERQAFRDGLLGYAYLDALETAVPVAYWIFEFPHPLGYLECNVNARLYRDSRMGKYLSAETNVLMLFLLDGPILQRSRLLGLHPEAVAKFKATLRKQLNTPFASVDYTMAIQAIERHEADELLSVSTYYKLR